ncbi:MAG TPA: hypothetical protein VJZ71_12860 [Phycisphaerae bacterium]|nr:hypothetical protein [Phycisphaerae bacterium]
MMRVHRSWHARLWPMLAIFIALGLAAALAVRSARRFDSQTPIPTAQAEQEQGR